MSWIIKGADKPDLRTEEEEIHVGDRVKVLPWGGRKFDIPYEYIEDQPTGKVRDIGDTHPLWPRYVNYVEISFDNGTQWIVPAEYVEAI